MAKKPKTKEEKAFMKIVGLNIQHARLRNGLKQEQLGALAFGYSLPKQKNAAQNKISSIETGNKEASASDLLRISYTLNVDIRIFFNGTTTLVRPKIIPLRKIAAESKFHS